jgi:serine protease AprX
MRRLGIGAVGALILIAMVPSTALSASSARPGDADGNKIVDGLDRAIARSGPGALHDVIVVFADGTSHGRARQAEDDIGSFESGYEYRTIPAVAARMSAGQIKALAARSETVQIQEDADMDFAMSSARSSFGSDKAQLDFGVDGNNEAGACPGAKVYCPDDTVVAVLDTGVDVNHVDLNGGKVLASKECSDGTCQAMSFYSGSHGTHVASIVAGEGEGNAAHRGVAPGAAIVSVKVGHQWGADQSGVDAGIEWVLANKVAYGIDLVNMSIASTGLTHGTDTTSILTNKLAAAGLSPFVAAGNDGPAAATVSSPGVAKYATTVGAMSDLQSSDWQVPLGFNLASFSSRGPTGDTRVKPDLAAPGVDITAADAAAPSNNYSSNAYAAHSGTSQAAPFAAGVGALMLDANPGLVSTGAVCPTGDTSSDCIDGVYDASMSIPLRDMITGSAIDWGPQGPDNEYGHGRLDAYAAVDAASSIAGTSGPAVPAHTFTQGELAGTGAVQNHPLSVTGTNYPIAITLVMPTWTSATTPNFNVTLHDPSGTQVAATALFTDQRQETIGYTPTATGTYTVRVTSVEGSGPYWFDASFAGAAAPAPPPPSPSPSPSPSPTLPAPPAAPGTFTATAASMSQINLSWANVASEDGYRLYRATASTGPWTSIASPGANVTSFADTGLAMGTTYYYRVVAFNAGGESPPASASARTLADTAAPSAPKSLKAMGAKAKISLTWTGSTDTGGSGLAGYKVFRSTTTSTGTFTQIATTTTASYADTAVVKGKVNYYYVVAYDNAGNISLKSNVVNAKST